MRIICISSLSDSRFVICLMKLEGNLRATAINAINDFGLARVENPEQTWMTSIVDYGLHFSYL